MENTYTKPFFSPWAQLTDYKDDTQSLTIVRRLNELLEKCICDMFGYGTDFKVPQLTVCPTNFSGTTGGYLVSFEDNNYYTMADIGNELVEVRATGPQRDVLGHSVELIVEKLVRNTGIYLLMEGEDSIKFACHIEFLWAMNTKIWKFKFIKIVFNAHIKSIEEAKRGIIDFHREHYTPLE